MASEKKFDGLCYHWNVTLYQDWTDEKGFRFEHKDEDVVKVIDGISKQYVLQLERGEQAGKLHYQIALSLHTKKRQSTLFNDLKAFWPNIQYKQIQRTSASGRIGKKAFNYCTKVDTRVRGPWSDKDRAPAFSQDVKLVIENKEFKFYPYQIEFINILKGTVGTRIVHCLIDPLGSIGKSFLKEYCYCMKIAFPLSITKDFGSLTKFVLSAGLSDQKAFVIDIPRAVYKKFYAMPEFWANIEQLKDGMLQDDRYHGQYELMLFKPHILLLLNDDVPENLLTNDRWLKWMVGPDKRLYKYDKVKAHQIADMMRPILEAKRALNGFQQQECPDPTALTIVA